MAERSDACSSIWLGFLDQENGDEERNGWKFPNKVGGLPVWIVPDQIPKEEDMRCGYCEEDLALLIQISAPLDGISKAFHRALYLFACKNGPCYKRGNKCLKVVRQQLPKQNEFYTPDTDEEDSDEEGQDRSGKDRREKVNRRRQLQEQTCDVCGFFASKRCGRCRVPRYCSQKHQVEHWKNGGHNEECKRLSENPKAPTSRKVRSQLRRSSRLNHKKLFKEWEMVTEPEPLSALKKSQEEKKQGEKEKKEGEGKELQVINDNWKVEDISKDDRFKDLKLGTEDKVFSYFRRRTGEEPDQILRYAAAVEVVKSEEKQGEGEREVEGDREKEMKKKKKNLNGPLFVSRQNQPQEGQDIPHCERCGSIRRFEFQVTPQLLYYFGVDKAEDSKNAIDWGTLLVYTCSNSCDDSSSSSSSVTSVIAPNEFAWIQFITSEGESDPELSAVVEETD